MLLVDVYLLPLVNSDAGYDDTGYYDNVDDNTLDRCGRTTNVFRLQHHPFLPMNCRYEYEGQASILVRTSLVRDLVLVLLVSDDDDCHYDDDD